jgi:multidrug transporter EmrE-like cation transporter
MANGSGDTTFEYVRLFTIALLAVLAAAVWSLLDRRRPSHARLDDALRTYVRYVLGFTMLSYGMAKVIPSQFPFPSVERLTTTYGESSPMGLLWTFMGYSPAYNLFSGLMESIAGVLLFWRRTTTLGALLAVVVMANIVALNFCYDVPVKLYSSNLLAMAVFLLLPEAKRLGGLFLANRPAPSVVLRPFPATGRRRWAWRGVKAAFVLWIVFANVSQAIESSSTYGPGVPKPILFGAYEVDEFVKDGASLPASLTSADRWRRVSFGRYATFWVRRMDDVRERYVLEIDEKNGKITLTPFSDRSRHDPWTYRRADEDHVELEGTIQGAKVTVKLKKIEDEHFPLVERGFHWINEAPLGAKPSRYALAHHDRAQP